MNGRTSTAQTVAMRTNGGPGPFRGAAGFAAALAFVVALAAASLAVSARAADADQTGPVLRPPVDAPVSDPFRAPENPYGPGNRGIEYATSPGEVVRATAAGTVVFAGPVAGELYVTVDHGGGLLSSYSYLSRFAVTKGAEVAQGDVIGFAGERYLHFSVRIEGEYVDPASFVGVRRVTVRLIPLGWA